MSTYVVLVEFIVGPGHVAEFCDLIMDNAHLSLQHEPGCRRFDVVVADDNHRRFVLYEIYESQSAFEEHLASAHFQEFNRRTSDFVTSKKVEIFRPAERLAALQ